MIAFIFAAAILAQTGETPALIPYEIEHDRSRIAFITHKAGVARGFVDNNLTYPAEYSGRIAISEDRSALAFSFAFAVNSMVVNDPEAQRAWYPHLHGLGYVDAPFSKTSERRRRRIRRAMLSEKQLDAEHYPRVDARSIDVRPDPKAGPNAYTVRIVVTMHGQAVTADWSGVLRSGDKGVRIDVYGPLKFSDFGIDAYSTLLGAIRYEDTFHVCARLWATPAKTAP